MVLASKVMSIGIIIFSIAIGFISFYAISDLPKARKKLHIEELLSNLINFIIFITIGKILLNFSVFIKDPLVILAYPSNSEAFYLAIVFSLIWIAYKSRKKEKDSSLFAESFLHIFLVSSIVYEFIQFVWNDRTQSFGYLVLLTILVVLFLAWRGKPLTIATRLFFIWSLGMAILSFFQPFVTVFGYIMAPWFIGVLLFTSIVLIISKQRKRD